MLALAVVALIAALALPRGLVGSQTGAARSTAMQIGALVRADRNAALRTGRPVVTVLDRQARVIRAGSTGAAVALGAPMPVVLQPATLSGFTFRPDGTSSGGAMLIGSGAKAYRIAVNPVTAAVAVDAIDLSTLAIASR